MGLRLDPLELAPKKSIAAHVLWLSLATIATWGGVGAPTAPAIGAHADHGAIGNHRGPSDGDMGGPAISLSGAIGGEAGGGGLIRDMLAWYPSPSIA